MRDLDRHLWAEPAVSVHGEIDVRPDRVAYRRHDPGRLPHDRSALNRLDRPEWDQLHGGKAALFQRQRALSELLRRLPPWAVGVDPDLVAHAASEELVDRLAERLSEDVPERLCDARDRGVHDRAAAVERVAVHHLPEVLDPERVLAYEVI